MLFFQGSVTTYNQACVIGGVAAAVGVIFVLLLLAVLILPTFCWQGADLQHSGCNRSCEEQSYNCPAAIPDINNLVGIAPQELPASSSQATHWRPVECNLVAQATSKSSLFNEKGT